MDALEARLRAETEAGTDISTESRNEDRLCRIAILQRLVADATYANALVDENDSTPARHELYETLRTAVERAMSRLEKIVEKGEKRAFVNLLTLVEFADLRRAKVAVVDSLRTESRPTPLEAEARRALVATAWENAGAWSTLRSVNVAEMRVVLTKARARNGVFRAFMRGVNICLAMAADLQQSIVGVLHDVKRYSDNYAYRVLLVETLATLASLLRFTFALLLAGGAFMSAASGYLNGNDPSVTSTLRTSYRLFASMTMLASLAARVAGPENTAVFAYTTTSLFFAMSRMSMPLFADETSALGIAATLMNAVVLATAVETATNGFAGRVLVSNGLVSFLRPPQNASYTQFFAKIFEASSELLSPTLVSMSPPNVQTIDVLKRAQADGVCNVPGNTTAWRNGTLAELVGPLTCLANDPTFGPLLDVSMPRTALDVVTRLRTTPSMREMTESPRLVTEMGLVTAHVYHDATQLTTIASTALFTLSARSMMTGGGRPMRDASVLGVIGASALNTALIAYRAPGIADAAFVATSSVTHSMALLLFYASAVTTTPMLALFVHALYIAGRVNNMEPVDVLEDVGLVNTTTVTNFTAGPSLARLHDAVDRHAAGSGTAADVRLAYDELVRESRK